MLLWRHNPEVPQVSVPLRQDTLNRPAFTSYDCVDALSSTDLAAARSVAPDKLSVLKQFVASRAFVTGAHVNVHSRDGLAEVTVSNIMVDPMSSRDICWEAGQNKLFEESD